MQNGEIYEPLFEAVYLVAAKAIAQKYIDKISGGSTVESEVRYHG